MSLVCVKVFATPEASIGFHTDCSFSYILSHLPGHLGECTTVELERLLSHHHRSIKVLETSNFDDNKEELNGK